MKLVPKRYKTAIVCSCLAISLWIGINAIQEGLFAETEKTYEELSLFGDVLDIIEKNYVDPVDPKKLIDGAINGMLYSLDPHSAYLAPDAYKELKIDTKGEFSGVGIVIAMKDNTLKVISPIEGSPAHKAGIKAGDTIISIDGQNTKDMQLWEAVKKMRGQKGSIVQIAIKRDGTESILNFSVKRDVIPITSVVGYTLEPAYGYLRITNFRDNTLGELKEHLGKIEHKDTPLKGLVLDLRDNPGGLLPQAIDVTDTFLEEGIIVSIKGRLPQHSREYSARPNKENEKHSYPIVLLINEGSASASEIVAGALQDHKRALILGATSFGKGSVQSVEPLKDGSALKLTIARYYTPSGRSIQAEGIKPDITVKERSLSKMSEGSHSRIKEKDLKNHISADPTADVKKKSENKDESNTEEERPNDPADDPTDIGDIPLPGRSESEIIEALVTKDNQVIRALEILKSWQIFSKIGYPGQKK